ncbi:MAG TPA: ATP-binding protein [Solirubrobacterales bacterium]|nr:ATP-binding protein [Solirubrobacterales bacterium]
MQTLRSDRLRAEFPLPPLRAGRLEFGLDGLHDVRALVGDRAADAGLSPRRASDLVVAASELATNSILYGRGRGLATVWEEDGALLVEVADAGTIADPTVGQVRPDPATEHGRGLYIADRLSDEMVIDSGPSGTRVRLRMDLKTG